MAKSRAWPPLQKQKRVDTTSFSHSPRKRVQVCSPGLFNQMVSLRSRRQGQLLQIGIQSSFRDYNTQCPVTTGEAEGMQQLVLGAVRLPEAQPLVGSSKHPSQTHPVVDTGLGVSMPLISPKFLPSFPAWFSRNACYWKCGLGNCWERRIWASPQNHLVKV